GFLPANSPKMLFGRGVSPGHGNAGSMMNSPEGVSLPLSGVVVGSIVPGSAVPGSLGAMLGAEHPASVSARASVRVTTAWLTRECVMVFPFARNRGRQVCRFTATVTGSDGPHNQ